MRWLLRIVGGMCVFLVHTISHASNVDVLLSPLPGDQAQITITGSGEDFDGSPTGSGTAASWFNLLGGNPFGNEIENSSFALAAPLSLTPGVNITEIQLDSDGNNAPLSDDLTLLFDGFLDFDGAFAIDGTTVLSNLSFTDLNPGVYTRTNSLGILTLTIAPVPLPAAAWMMLAALGALGALKRYRSSA